MESFNFERAEEEFKKNYLDLDDIDLEITILDPGGFGTCFSLKEYLRRFKSGAGYKEEKEFVREVLVSMGISLDLADKLTFVDTECNG